MKRKLRVSKGPGAFILNGKHQDIECIAFPLTYDEEEEYRQLGFEEELQSAESQLAEQYARYYRP